MGIWANKLMQTILRQTILHNKKNYSSKKLLVVMFLSAGVLSPFNSYASNLEKLLFSKLPSNKVQINLFGDETFPEPKIFSTKDPARVVFDFYGMKSKLDVNRYNIKIGAVDTLQIVQVADRTRVVMNLIASAPYQISQEQNQFIINVNPIDKGLSDKAEIQPFAPQPNLPKDQSLVNIDFHRTEKGGGRIIVNLSDAETSVNLKQQDGQIIVDFKNINIPSNLEKRLDVTDFATPVRAVETFQNGEHVRMIIEPLGQYQQVSYQNDDIFTVILDPIDKKKEEKKPETNESGYSGERLSMNFQRLEVRSALSVIADFTGLNIIASDDVQGDLTLNLKDVPWDQALDVILETKGLAKRQKGNVIWVAPAQRLADFEKLQLEAAKTSEALEPLISEILEINYAKAIDLRDVILEDREDIENDDEENRQIVLVQSGSAETDQENASNASASLQITVDERTNSLIITTTASNLKVIKALIAKLDRPVRQVMVETRIVSANDNFSKELGAKLGFQRLTENASGPNSSNFGSTAGSGTLSGANAVQSSFLDGDGLFDATTEPGNLSVDLGANGALGNSPASYAFSLFKAGTGYANIINLELSALEAEAKGKIVSSPRLVTSNQQEARISTGESRFITTTNSQGTTVLQSRDALLSLAVRPQISPDDTIVMDVIITQDFFLATNAIRRNNIITQVTVDNGETVIIGGIYQEQEAKEITKVPILGDIPVLKRLFRKTSKSQDRTELIIFLTPKIIDGELDIG